MYLNKISKGLNCPFFYLNNSKNDINIEYIRTDAVPITNTPTANVNRLTMISIMNSNRFI
jgi:hypothetical protein